MRNLGVAVDGYWLREGLPAETADPTARISRVPAWLERPADNNVAAAILVESTPQPQSQRPLRICQNKTISRCRVSFLQSLTWVVARYSQSAQWLRVW